MLPRLLLTYPRLASFVRDDIGLLSERYDVRTFAFDVQGGGGVVGRAQALARRAAEQRRWLRAEAPGADVILSWFADYHAVFPVRAGRQFGVPVAVILGGFDSNRLPELDYGVYESRWRAPLARYVLRRADLLLPVSGALIESENRFATWPRARAQGVQVHAGDLDTPYAVLPTGYEAESWSMGPAERGQTVCTVGFVSASRTVRLKGIDLLIETARRMPEVTFTVLGVTAEQQTWLRAEYTPPQNVQLLDPQPRERLAEAYGSASVYAQLSRSEGMPNVLCEAMLCGCIPVGSRVGGIPDAIGGAGEIVEAPDPVRIADAIRTAFARAPEGRQAARDHILARFTRAHRRQRFFQLLAGLAKR
ncbi:MAG: glycosyltransferase family 4 protein [Bacteroidota bacterium]